MNWTRTGRTVVTILACYALGCSGTTVSKKSEQPYPNVDEQIANINQVISESSWLVERGLDRASKIKSTKERTARVSKIQDAYGAVFVAGNTYIATLADFVEAGKDANEKSQSILSAQAQTVGNAVVALRTAVEESTAGGAVSEITGALIDAGIRIYNAYKERQKAERQAEAAIIRRKTWKPWSEFKVSSVELNRSEQRYGSFSVTREPARC